ncbi:MAG: hypothetical protein JNK48_24120 [Bryobacterales bacterium]|nr:hypothetical protein [Bryobacterales bacterium]
MKKLNMILALAAWAAIAMTASAQTMPAMKLRINHSFAVAQSWLPAGDYEIRTVDNGSDQPVLLIRSDYGSVLVAANRYDSNGAVAAKPEAIFEMENNKVYLKRIKMAGRSYGFQVIGAPAVAAD